MAGYTIADTIYDQTHTWQNMNDRVSYQRILGEDDRPVVRKIATALLTANPLTQNIEIQMNMNQPAIPPRFGYDNTQPDIVDVLSIDKDGISTGDYPGRTTDRPPTDFSGQEGAWEGTSMPAIVW